MGLSKFLSRFLFKKFNGISIDDFYRMRDDIASLQHFRNRFRTRVYMSSDLLLPSPERGKLSYGYEKSNVNSSYRDFENIFRGDESFIKERLRAYSPFFAKDSRVVDIGCGRGEFLEILKEKNVDYVGVDLDESMIERCLEKDLRSVVKSDFEIYLKGVDSSNFDGIFSAQFIEHIAPEKIMDFFKLCYSSIKPGGVLAVETVNPYCIEAFRTFHVDLTHQKNIYPEVLLYYCMIAGFNKASIFYPNHGGFKEDEYDDSSEYAVIAYK